MPKPEMVEPLNALLEFDTAVEKGAKSNPNTVFSTTRTLVSPPPIDLPFDCNTRIRMDGLELLRQLDTDTFPLAFFDPQYRSVLNRQKYGNEGARLKGRAELPQMTDDQIRDFVREIGRVLIPQGHLLLWCDKFTICSGDAIKWTTQSGLKLVDMITWNKLRMGMGYRSRRQSEHLVVLQKSPIRAKGVWGNHSIPDVWDEKVKSRHAHTKPLLLQSTLIKALTQKGDVVLDPAAGGYSVLEAANNVGRHFLGCDLAT